MRKNDKDIKVSDLPIAPEADESNAVEAPAVLISNSGKDYFDTGASERNYAFQRFMARMRDGEEADSPYNDERGNKDDEKFSGFTRFLLEENLREIQDMWSQGTNFNFLSYSSLDNKELTADEVIQADTRDARVSDMRVLRVRTRGGQDRYFTGTAMPKGMEMCRADSLSCEGTTIGALQYRAVDQDLERYKPLKTATLGGPTALAPDLVKRMQKDPKLSNYVAIAQEEAKKVGIDPNMYANQLWQESRFNPRAVSPAGARGIAQMMPDKVGKFGLQSSDDFYDAEKSIRAGARMMAGLTGKYGDQRMALVAYNGGGRAIDFVEKSLGRQKVSFEEWHDYMSDRRSKLGSANRGAWHVETLDYTNKIALAGTQITKPSDAPTVVASAKPDRKPSGPQREPSLDLNS